MTLPPLTIIPAGAGSGKTYTIQKTLAQWVSEGLVRPDRIVAVTFTEAAAAEMRDRIRAELTSQGRLEDALLLEQSYISTIHAFGLRILTEFAFDCGLSPQPRLLNEDEEATLMRRALAVTDRADEVMADLAAFGYSYDHKSGKGAEALFRDAVLKLIGKLRSIGRLTEDEQLLPHAERLVTELYGSPGNAEQLENLLHEAVVRLLKQYSADLTEVYGDSDTAIKALRQNYRDLKEAEKRAPLARDWKLWQHLRGLRTTKMPADYVQLAEEVMQAAGGLPLHPGPLADALTHVRALLGSSQDALSLHAEKKREKGLLDYTDMLALSYTLLTENAAVRTMLRERIDCLIIDEFQDTNPLQFSLLWHFRSMGVPTLVVGDLKQAIMGFQNADSRLLEALQHQHPDECRPLDANWRSTPALMDWINRLGSGLFKAQYTHLTAKADFPSVMSPLEAVLLRKRPKKICYQARETALRVKALLTSGSEMVYDRTSKVSRPLKGGDIALLCPTNDRLDLYAESLRAVGLRTRIAQDGWFQSRIVQIACHALTYVTDPADRHAILYLCATELGAHSLETALTCLIGGTLPDDPVLASLQPVCNGTSDRTITTLLTEVINALDLYERISVWPDGQQARANLLRLQHEALQFQEAEPDALTGGGYYGFGPKTFLAWLKALTEQDEQNGQPAPRVYDEESVELVTWHSAKGREWPVVVVASLDSNVYPRLPSLDVVYENFDDLVGLMEQARVEISPDFAAPEISDRFAGRLMEGTVTGAFRLLYVAFTRAREKLIIEWPEYLLKSKAKKATYWSLLTARTGISLAGTNLMIGGMAFDCRVVEADVAEVRAIPACEAPQWLLQTFGRRAVRKAAMITPETPDSLTPSLLHADAVLVSGLETVSYAPPLHIDLDLAPVDRGTLLHCCFELGSTTTLTSEKAARILGYALTAGQWQSLREAVGAFDAWLQKSLSPLMVARELPVLYQDGQGSIVSGIIDLLVETSDGFWIIDHKSDVTDDHEARFGNYVPQLNSYREAVSKARPEKPVLGVGIHWITVGRVTWLKS